MYLTIIEILHYVAKQQFLCKIVFFLWLYDSCHDINMAKFFKLYSMKFNSQCFFFSRLGINIIF